MFPNGTVHLSLCVNDLKEARRFYEAIFNAKPAYSGGDTAHYRLHACHLVLRELADYRAATVEVDDEGWNVPVPHYGFIVNRDEWDAIRHRVTDGGYEVVLKPVRRRVGTQAEHEVFFIRDPDAHAIEIKTYEKPVGCALGSPRSHG